MGASVYRQIKYFGLLTCRESPDRTVSMSAWLSAGGNQMLCLFETEKRVDISKYNNMQKRLFGFISERLLNVWVKHNALRIKELNMFNTESKKTAVITSRIYNIARYVFNIDILYFQVNRKLKLYHGE